MNYLGHLFFSGSDKELMYANLFGDYVKGSDLSAYPLLIQKGIKLHRTIDFYIDNHDEVKKLKKVMYKWMPKVSGIAIDLLFDHLLAKNWRMHSQLEYQSFLEDFYAYQPQMFDQYPIAFKSFIENLKKYRWMNVYHQEFGLIKMSEGVSRKISFDNKLTLLPEFYRMHERKVNGIFNLFMKDAVNYFSDFNQEEN
jgi:acyl carrier protein phosphodiesterase